jgi:hypothetical protein
MTTGAGEVIKGAYGLEIWRAEFRDNMRQFCDAALLFR